MVLFNISKQITRATIVVTRKYLKDYSVKNLFHSGRLAERYIKSLLAIKEMAGHKKSGKKTACKLFLFVSFFRLLRGAIGIAITI